MTRETIKLPAYRLFNMLITKMMRITKEDKARLVNLKALKDARLRTIEVEVEARKKLMQP